MFDLEKLKNIDFQNIDLSKIDINKITETVLSKKDLFISLVIGVVSCLIAIILTKDYFSQTSELNSDIFLLRKKIDVIATYDSSKKKIRNFLKTIPQPLDEDLFSSTITDMAAANNVTVISFVPGQDKDENLYSYFSGSFELEAQNYPSLLSFLKAIETAPFALRIDNCVILKGSNDDRMQSSMQNKEVPKDLDVIKIHLDLTSIQIKK